MQHILIVDDHQDITENLERKFSKVFPNSIVYTASNCDIAFDYIKLNKVNKPISLLILDLSFNHNPSNVVLKEGFELLDAIKKASISIKTIIYTSHKTIFHIHPIMEAFNPEGYVIKTHISNSVLLNASNMVIEGGRYYDSVIIEARFTRLGYEKKLDSIDRAILKKLPEIVDVTKDWEGVIIKKDGTPMSYNSIKTRLDKMLDKFEVDTQAQLLLKLQKGGFLD